MKERKLMEMAMEETFHLEYGGPTR